MNAADNQFVLNPIYTDKHFGQIHELPEMPKNKTVFLITDENVFRHWSFLFRDFETIVLPAGESQKTLTNIEILVHELLKRGADRSSFLLGVGGGVICDITGFTASVFMRGIPFAFVPTTLLAQTDASIGGKNGVNTDFFKNMIGVFRFPEFILTDINFLKSLKDEDFRDGLAEVVKHACIKDREHFIFLEQHLQKILDGDEDVLAKIIQDSVRIKSDVVSADPFEKNERKLLNFGHTFGHAVEKTLGISHGKAVSIGIKIVNDAAVKTGLLSQNEAQRIHDLLTRFGLPVDFQGDLKSLLPLVKNDKKKKGTKISLILLNEIGNAGIFETETEDLF